MASTSTGLGRKRKNIIDSDDEDGCSPNILTAGSDLVLKAAGGNQFSHSRDAHNLDLTAAQSIQQQLTTWFLGVHDARNMPWRRRWDPTLTREAKAQRAYEVRPVISRACGG
jgi:A/G-specific adenine glycosylase